MGNVLFFSRRELAAVVAVGLVTGLLDGRLETLEFAVVDHVYPLVVLNDYLAYVTGGPVFGDLLITWLEFGGVLAACLVRKPAAATLALTVNGLCQVFVNGNHDPHLLYGVAGLGGDLVLATLRYRRYDLSAVALAGTASATFWYTVVWFTHGIYLYPVPFILADLALRALGGAIGDGLLAGAFAYALLRLAGRRWNDFPSQTRIAGPGALEMADRLAFLVASFGVLLVVLTFAFPSVSNFFVSVGPQIPSGNPLLEEFNPGYVIGIELVFVSLALVLLWHLASQYWGEGAA